jgi:pyruvate/2-oxoglutarate dehydrogenase complex dihydrolipoamide acyltransferase (E2) component
VHDHEQTQKAGGRAGKQPAAPTPNIASQVGNAGSARLVKGEGLDHGGGGPAHLDREIARAIDERRGRGRELDGDARSNLESAMGEDFSDVRVHDDAEAHDLSTAVSAEAFTTGSDVFFQSGKYEPASSAGQKLLAHELTHVSQQRGATPTSDMTVSEPGDASEVEAASVADKITSAPSPASAQATANVSRAAEEEELQMSRLDRAGAEEEEPLQG